MKRYQLFLGDLIALLSVLVIGALMIVGGAAYGMNHYQKMHPETVPTTIEKDWLTQLTEAGK